MAIGKRPQFVKEKTAVKYFNLIKKQLSDAGIPFEECDTVIMGTLANALVQYERANEKLDEGGAVIETPTAFKKSPWVEYSKDLQITIRDCLKQLNMTPASRKVGIDESDDSEGDPLAAFLDNGINKGKK